MDFVSTKIFFLFLSVLFITDPLHSAPPAELFIPQRVTYTFGTTFLQAQKLEGNPPVELKQNQSIKIPYPYAVIASKDSYLEIHQSENEHTSIIRLGKTTGLEFREKHEIYLFQGSALLSHRVYLQWNVHSAKSQFTIQGKGTWMMEATPLGFKVIILEGSLALASNDKTESFKPGDLILVSDREGKISQDLEIELPLLLGTSKLLNHFPDLLPSHSRLISAAQVQAMRMKKKYEAMIGGVRSNRKLEIWQIPKAEQP